MRRDELRTRILTEATTMLATYLAAEKALGRITPEADTDTLPLTLIGSAHLLFADRTDAPPNLEATRKVVTTVIASTLR